MKEYFPGIGFLGEERIIHKGTFSECKDWRELGNRGKSLWDLTQDSDRRNRNSWIYLSRFSLVFS